MVRQILQLDDSRLAEIFAATDFLHHLKMKFPFPIKTIQIDGGSEFKDQFEAACQKQRIELFVNPPRRPAMNGGVERSNRTSWEEFFEVQDLSLVTADLNRQSPFLPGAGLSDALWILLSMEEKSEVPDVTNVLTPYTPRRGLIQAH